jgi:hypothetical protein
MFRRKSHPQWTDTSIVTTFSNKTVLTIIILIKCAGFTLGKWPTCCVITLYNTLYCYNPLHVSSNSVLIIRTSNCINTASGIVFSVSDRPACTPDGHLLTVLYQMLYLYNSASWWWAQCCSKHVEDYNNKRFIERNCASSWSFTQSCTSMHGQQNIK